MVTRLHELMADEAVRVSVRLRPHADRHDSRYGDLSRKASGLRCHGSQRAKVWRLRSSVLVYLRQGCCAHRRRHRRSQHTCTHPPVASAPTSSFSFTAWTGCSLTEPRNLSSITGTSSFLGGLSLPSSCPEASERSLLYCSFSSDHRTAEASQAELMADLGCTVGAHARHTDSRRQCNRSPSGLRVQAVADAWAGFTHSLLAYGQVGAFAGSRTRAP